MAEAAKPDSTIEVTTERYEVNDALTAALASLGWTSSTEADDEWLNELTHQVADAVSGKALAPRHEPLAPEDVIEGPVRVTWAIDEDGDGEPRSAAAAAARIWRDQFGRTMAGADDACVFEVEAGPGRSVAVDLSQHDLDAL